MSDDMTLGSRLGRIEQKLEDLVGVADSTLEQARATNGRLRALELWKARIEGARMFLGWVPGAAAGGAVVFLGHLIWH